MASEVKSRTILTDADLNVINLNILSPTSKNIRKEIISPIPSRFDKELRTADIGSPTELYKLIKNREWDKAITRIKENGDEASTWIIDRGDNIKVNWRSLPIHEACKNKPTEDLLKRIITAYPRGLQLKDTMGSLSLHSACREIADLSIITLLLKYYPEGAQIKDNEGRLPLHLACRQGVRKIVADKLLIAYKKAAMVTDNNGLLPVHWACIEKASLEVVESQITAFPNCINLKDNCGRTAIDIIESGDHPLKEKLMNLFRNQITTESSSIALSDVETVVQSTDVCSIEDDEPITKVIEVKEGEEETEENAVHLVEVENDFGMDVRSLEAKLMEVSATSSAAAHSFRSLRDTLMDENISLKSSLQRLTAKNEGQEEKIGALIGENTKLKAEIDDMTQKNQQFAKYINDMDEQRQFILDVTNKWEDALRAADDVLPSIE